LVIAPSIAMNNDAVAAYVDAKVETNLVEVVVTEDKSDEKNYTVNVTSQDDQEMVVEVTINENQSSTGVSSKE
jgi:hypothetical protein